MITELGHSKITKNYRGLGTVINLTIFGSQDKELLDESNELIQYYEKIFTVNRETSEVLSISDKAGMEPVQVSLATFVLVKKAIEKSLEHFGFNATIGPLVKLWHIGFRDARVPSKSEIIEKLQLTNPVNIELNPINQTIFLKEAGMELDLGAIAKGYIADRVADLWKSWSIQSGIINLGGNLLLVGNAPHQPDLKWRVGIRDPLRSTKETIAVIKSGAGSVVTSGISERAFTQEGKSYHHIIDPETGYPHDNNIASVTVLTDESIDGEVETTRLFFADAIPNQYKFPAIIAYRDKSITLLNFDENNIQITDSEYYIKEILNKVY